MSTSPDKSADPSACLPVIVERQLCSELSRVDGQANEMLLRFIGHGLAEAERYLELEAEPQTESA